MIRSPRRSAAVALLLACVQLPVFACAPANVPIRIGLAGPFDDPNGAPMRRSAELAVEQINLTGGIAGRRVELVLRNDYGDPDSAVNAATELVDAGVVAVIGHVYSGTTLAAAPVYNAARVLQISPSSSSPLVTHAGEFTFRVCPSDLQHGDALARFTADRLGLKRGTILYLNNEYGRGIRSTFAQEYSRRGGRIDATDPYLGDTPSVGPYLDRLVHQHTSEFVFIGGNVSEAEEVLRQAKARGIKVPFLGGDALEGLEEAGALAEGTYISKAYLATFDTPANRLFVQAYARKYPTALPPNQTAASTYDVVFMLKDAIRRIGTDRVQLRNAIAEIGRSSPPYDGATGAIAFDDNGDVPRQRVIIGRIEHGQIRAVEGL